MMVMYYKEQDNLILEMQAQLDILYKVAMPFLMNILRFIQLTNSF